MIEKAGADAEDLKRLFGDRVSGVVLAVSDDDRIRGYATRKAALRRQVAGAGEEALLLFAADKLSKLRELRRETHADEARTGLPRPVRELRARRLRHYQRSLALLEERVPDSPLVRELRAELHLFARQRRVPVEAR